jgi:hypothetical protein
VIGGLVEVVRKFRLIRLMIYLWHRIIGNHKVLIEAQMAQQMGYPLCLCKYPPEVMRQCSDENKLCTRQKFKTPALPHILRAMISGFCPLTMTISGGHKNSSNSLNLSSIFWNPCNRLLVR